MSRSGKIVVIALAAVVLAVGGVYGYLLFVRDDGPAALSTDDLDQALATTAAPVTTAPVTTAPVTTAPVTTVADATGPLTGTWTMGGDSVVGYRIQEVLGGVDTEAVGRTDQVTGSLTLEGDDTALTATTATFTVDMASVTSDSDRRDGQYRTRIMTTDQFPTATFTLTAPIAIGARPPEGTTFEAAATGDLTLRGVTRSVTFTLQAKLSNGRVGVLGSIPITFADYQIPEPSNPFAKVEPAGLLEFVLVFDRT